MPIHLAENGSSERAYDDPGCITVFMRNVHTITSAREHVIADITRYAYDYVVAQYRKP
jgi:hypothetical protein